MSTKTITNFLMETWSQHCRPGDYTFICTRDPKNKKGWVDHPIRYGKRANAKIRSLIEHYPPDQYDLYFCPLPFKTAKRDKDKVSRLKMLWQDLDYADPKKFDRSLQPTVYWESSPGRFHGLWHLDKVKEVSEVEALNRDLAYHLGADKGGWDLTQVLRIPGTRNHKYKEKPLVKLKSTAHTTYTFETLRGKVKEQKMATSSLSLGSIEEGEPRDILDRWASKLPRTVLVLLRQTDPPRVGERSDKIWFLENKLFEAGLTPSEIFTLIKHSVWNKYIERDDQDLRLLREMEKIINSTLEQTGSAGAHFDGDQILSTENGSSFKVESYSSVMSNLKDYPGWLIEGFWARRSHGIVAGEPKSFKSTYAMDLAISVASGEPFLGKYEVKEPGPVIYIQNENAGWIIKDRMEKIIKTRGLAGKVTSVPGTNDRRLKVAFPRDIPLHFINQQGFLLDDVEHQKLLEALIEEVKPVLIIFDPLYLMFNGDINSAKELNPILSWMLHVKNKFKTGVMAIHHYNKGGSGTHWKGGQRMLGSTTLYGWIESAWYLQRLKPGEDQEANVESQSKKPSLTVFDREFRNAGQFPKLQLGLSMGEIGEPEYEVSVEVYQDPEENGGSVDTGYKRKTPEELAADIERIMKSENKNSITMTELKKLTGQKAEKIMPALDELIISGNYVKAKGGGIKKSTKQ